MENIQSVANSKLDTKGKKEYNCLVVEDDDTIRRKKCRGREGEGRK